MNTLEALKLARRSWGALHDQVSDLVEGGRLTESMIPDDYMALTSALVGCARVDDETAHAIKAASVCCHAGDPLICSHACPVCRLDEARQLAASIRAFDRQCQRDEETDTGRAWELLTEARKLLTKITKEAATR